MPDNAATPPAPVDPFNDDNWSPSPSADTPPVDPANPPAPVVVDPANPPAPAAAAPAAAKPDDDIFDADAYLKEQVGLDSWDAAKAAIAEWKDLKEKAKTPAEFKYANEMSERIAKAINEGQEDPLYDYLDQKRKLTKAKSLDANNPDNAANLVKLNWQLQNGDLSPDDVDFMFRKKFSTPRKPVQGIDQTDDDYASDVNEWQQRVKDVEREMIIEAKLAKPNLSKYESQLVLPETKKADTAAAPPPPTQEELDKRAKDRQTYLTATDAGIKNLKEFKATVKDEEVELPISYLVSDEERAKTKAITDSLCDGFDYFMDRWHNADGTLNEAKLVEDITLLENKEKIFQKIANESAAKRLAHKITVSKNPVVAPNANGKPNPALNKSIKEQEIDYMWQNS